MILLALGASAAHGQESEPTAPPSVEDEVLANIRNQKIGDHALADYNLPEPFLRHIADGVIREEFWKRNHVVIDDAAAAASSSAGAEASQADTAMPLRSKLIYGLGAAMLLIGLGGILLGKLRRKEART